MKEEQILSAILNSFPYPVLFVDCNHVIRYMNNPAKYHYYVEKGYKDLLGKSLLDCHDPESRQKILNAINEIKVHGKEIYLGISRKNLRMYINPVHNDDGELIGYFERFELNL